MDARRSSPADPMPDGDRGASDAALLIERVGRELSGLSAAVGDLQRALGPALSMAAAQEPEILLQAQKLDLIEQSLNGLAAFLSVVGRRRVGRDPLDLDGVATVLTLTSLAERLTGQTPRGRPGDIDLF